MKNQKLTRFRKIGKEFRDFAMKGNAIDLAIGVVIGAAFKDIVDILVQGIIMPPLGLLTGKIDFTSLYWNITGDSEITITQAEEAGDVIIKYGELINTVINFLIIAIVIFIVVKQMNRLYRKDEEVKKKKIGRKCDYCFKEIHDKAKRCPHCTSELNVKNS